MSVQVETLDKLERRITLVLPSETILGEVQTRLKRLARTVKADGFRPGKVPMSVVSMRYGYSVQNEVVNDRVGAAFAEAAGQAKLRVAGVPRITQNEKAPEGQLAFDATFEVYPEVRLGELSAAQIERISTEVTEAAIDRTIETTLTCSGPRSIRSPRKIAWRPSGGTQPWASSWLKSVATSTLTLFPDSAPHASVAAITELVSASPDDAMSIVSS